MDRQRQLSAGPTAVATRSYGVRASLLFGAIFLFGGTHLPFFPLWLEWRGLKPESIAIILALPPLVRTLFTPLIAHAADRTGDHRLALIGLALASCATQIGLYLAADFWPILLVVVLYAAVGPAMMPLSEVIALKGVRAGIDYGRMRVAGSLTFILANVIGGLAIAYQGPAAVTHLLVASTLLSLAAAFALRPLAGSTEAAPATLRTVHGGGLAELAGSPMFLLFLLCGAAISTSHAVLYAFGTLHWQAQGIGPRIAGVLWALGVLAEIVLFYFSRRIVERLGPVRLLLIGAGAAVVRWSLMALDPPLAVLVPLQILHAATFGAAHLGGMHFIVRAVPEGQIATAQGLYSATTAGIAMAAALYASGRLYEGFGGRAYLAMAVLGLIGVGAAWPLLKHWDGRRLFENVDERRRA